MAECRLFEGSGFMTQNNSEIAAFVEKLAEVGSHYRMDEMEELYSEDLAFLVLTPDGEISRFSKAGIFEEFRSRRDAGELPLLTTKRFLHIEAQGDEATVILFRQMSEKATPAFYELRLRKQEGNWKVCGETVLPWPDLSQAGSFLPPREKQSPDQTGT